MFHYVRTQHGKDEKVGRGVWGRGRINEKESIKKKGSFWKKNTRQQIFCYTGGGRKTKKGGGEEKC